MRMRTRLRAALVVTVLIAIAMLVLAFTVVPSTQQKQQADDAGRVARAYERELARSLNDLVAYVVKRRFENETDYQKLYDQVTERIKAVPRIPAKGTTAYGREQSRDYRNAATRRDLGIEQFEQFAAQLKGSFIPRQEFVEAGIDLVQISPAKLLEGFTVQLSGEPLRTEVVPAYKKARKKLLDQEPGDENAPLARDLEKYADEAIAMTRDGADDIEAGRAFFFDFGDKPDVLLTRLESAQRSIAAEVSTQVDAFDRSAGAVNDVPGQGVESDGD